MKSGTELIAEEREEQVKKHGFSLKNDAKYYQKKELVQAATYCLMLADYKSYAGVNVFWPDGWDRYFENKILNKTKVGKLTVAGAFLMAENDRRKDKFYEDAIDEIASEIDRLQTPEEIKNKSKRDKEEILEDHYTPEFDHVKEAILKAMDEFATAFTFWVTKYYFRKSEEDIWFNGCDLLGEEPLTTAQLLEEYKNDFKKLPASPSLIQKGERTGG